MAEILNYLFKSFVLLRDLVGYLIPGLAFLALLEPGRDLDFVASNPGWVPLSAVLLAGYGAAQVLAAAGYAAMRNLHRVDESDEDRAVRYMEVTYYSAAYPDMFIQSGREETMHLMRIGLSVALIFAGALHLVLIGIALFHAGQSVELLSLLAWIVCPVAGALLYWNCFEGDDYFRKMEKAAVEASRWAEAAGVVKAHVGAIEREPAASANPPGNRVT
jgi:hypothetical protein